MFMEDLRYLISAIIAIGERSGENEPPFRDSQFFGRWNEVRRSLRLLQRWRWRRNKKPRIQNTISRKAPCPSSVG